MWQIGCALLAWTGSTLCLSRSAWANRRSLTDRLGPYVTGAGQTRKDFVEDSAEVRQVLATLWHQCVERLNAMLGLQGSLASRLERLHDHRSVHEVRVQHGLVAGGCFLAAAVLAGPVALPVAPKLLLLGCAPVLALLLAEQRISGADERRRQRLVLELPIVAEQIGMLIESGYSLTGAIDRLAMRGEGVIAQDLRRVMRRVRQGLSEAEALSEWAALSTVTAVERLVGVLGLSGEAADLGRLISEEARSVRREVHRQLSADLDRRAQQVWIPVTVATLVPGTLLLGVPFLAAMRLYAAG